MTTAIRKLIIDGILANPSITIGALNEGGKAAGIVLDITVQELLSGRPISIQDILPPIPPGGISIGYGVRSDPADGAFTIDGVRTRTKAQRIDFDRHVLEVLGQLDDNDSLGSQSLQELVGHPTPDQLRKSLHRSVEAKLVKRRGRARGSRYWLTAKGRKALAS